MNLVGIMLIIIVIFFFIAMISSGSSDQGGGNKKGKFGVVGLVIAIFAILGLSNYFQTVM